MLRNPTTFFNRVRANLYAGVLSDAQVRGINVTLDAWDRYGDGNLNRLAYVLATEKHETGHTMQPVRETFATSDAQAIARLDNAWAKGQLPWVSKPYWRGGWFGRGKVQLTHEFNYKGKARAAVLAEFGIDIHANPSALLREDISAFVLVRGTVEGWFTGKDLNDYIDDVDESDAEDLREFVAARRTVNGQDKAKAIGKYALLFEAALQDGGYSRGIAKPVDPIKPSLWSLLTALISAIFTRTK